MTQGRPSKSYFFIASILEILFGITFFVFCPPVISEAFRFWLTLITTSLGIIGAFSELFIDFQFKASEKSVSRTMFLSIVGLSLIWLFLKIFIIDEFFGGSKYMLWSVTFLIMLFTRECVIRYLKYVCIKIKELESSILASANIDNPNIRIKIPGRSCAVWSMILSTSLFYFAMGLLSVLYRYPRMFKTINKFYCYTAYEGWHYIKINGLLYITIWLCAAFLGLSLYLGRRAKKKGFDCCIASAGISIATAGLIVVVVLSILSQF